MASTKGAMGNLKLGAGLLGSAVLCVVFSGPPLHHGLPASEPRLALTVIGLASAVCGWVAMAVGVAQAARTVELRQTLAVAAALSTAVLFMGWVAAAWWASGGAGLMDDAWINVSLSGLAWLALTGGTVVLLHTGRRRTPPRANDNGASSSGRPTMQ